MDRILLHIEEYDLEFQSDFRCAFVYERPHLPMSYLRKAETHKEKCPV